jgi:hypothetical protein
MSRKFGVEFIVLNLTSPAGGADYYRFAKAGRNPSAMKSAPVKHRRVRAKAGRELFTRASFPIEQGRK